MIEENFQAMTELAQAHGIKVILCSITPIADYGRAKMSEGRPPPTSSSSMLAERLRRQGARPLRRLLRRPGG